MGKKALILAGFIVLVISLGIFSLKGFTKDQKSVKEQDDLSVVSEKVDEVLKNQQDIIARLKDIREQQDIIRVRASRR